MLCISRPVQKSRHVVSGWWHKDLMLSCSATWEISNKVSFVTTTFQIRSGYQSADMYQGGEFLVLAWLKFKYWTHTESPLLMFSCCFYCLKFKPIHKNQSLAPTVWGDASSQKEKPKGFKVFYHLLFSNVDDYHQTVISNVTFFQG